MPGKQSTRTRRTRRNKRNASNPAQAVAQRVPRLSGPLSLVSKSDPFPPEYPCKLRYVERVTLSTFGTSSSAFGPEYVMAINNLFDPNFSGGGHQPQGFDQLAALYKRYTVLVCDIDVTFSDPSADGLVCAAMLQPSDGTFSLSSASLDSIVERPNVASRVLSNTGSQRWRFHQAAPIAAVEGITSMAVYNDTTGMYGRVLCTTSPTAPVWCRVACASIAALASTQTVQVLIQLTFTAVFTNRVDLATS